MMKIKITRNLFLLAVLFGLGACEIINPEEEIPAFLHIEPFELSTNPLGEGSASENITDAWVFINGEFVGAYEPPITVPILAAGPQEVRVSAGIRENGIRALPEIYLLYLDFNTTIDFAANEDDTIRPVTSYISDLKFLLEPQEDFESSSILFDQDLDDNPATNIVRTTEDIFEGDFSGHIQLTTDEPSIELGSPFIESVPFPTGARVYMELNYKTDVVVVFGVIGYDAQGNRNFSAFEKGINPRDTWNKIYFNFTEEILSFSQSATSGVVFYQFCLHSQITDEQEEGNIYLDNIKWITF
ncbi:MAG: hypothetical protein AAGD05_17510 [Bacteroidota bacterium]